MTAQAINILHHRLALSARQDYRRGRTRRLLRENALTIALVAVLCALVALGVR